MLILGISNHSYICKSRRECLPGAAAPELIFSQITRCGMSPGQRCFCPEDGSAPAEHSKKTDQHRKYRMQMKHLFMTVAALFLGAACSKRESAEELASRSRALLENREYAMAMMTLNEAKECAGPQDPALRAEINRMLGRCHKAMGDDYEAVSCFITSVQEFEAAGKKANARQSLCETGMAYHRLNDHKQAAQAYRTVIHGAREAGDTLAEASALCAYAALCVDRAVAEPSRAVSMISRAENELRYPLSAAEMGLMAYANALIGKKEAASEWMERARKNVNGDADLQEVKYREYQISKMEGDCRRALSALETVFDRNSSARKTDMRDSVMRQQSELLGRQKELARAELQASRMKMLFLLAVMLAAATAFAGYFRAQKITAEKTLEKEKEETEKYMSLAEELRGRLKKSSRTDVLERLCENYYVYEGTDKLKPKVLNEVKSVISGLRENPKTFRELEEILNLSHDGAVDRFKEQIPRLKEEDVRLFVFAASGLSSTAMSTLMEMEKSVVYNRIYRLKGRIAKADAADKDLFLRLLNS